MTNENETVVKTTEDVSEKQIETLRRQIKELSAFAEYHKPRLVEKMLATTIGDILIRSNGQRDIVIVKPYNTGGYGKKSLECLLYRQVE